MSAAARSSVATSVTWSGVPNRRAASRSAFASPGPGSGVMPARSAASSDLASASTSPTASIRDAKPNGRADQAQHDRADYRRDKRRHADEVRRVVTHLEVEAEPLCDGGREQEQDGVDQEADQ